MSDNKYPQYTDEPTTEKIGDFTITYRLEYDSDWQPTEFHGSFSKNIAEYSLDRVVGVLWGEQISESHDLPLSEFAFDDNDEPAESDIEKMYCFLWPNEYRQFLDNSHCENYLDFGFEWEPGDSVVTVWFDGYRYIGEVYTAWERGSYEYSTFPFIEWGSPESTWVKQAQRFEDFYRAEWCYVGAIVTIDYAGSELARDSLWGIESDSGEYFSEVFQDLRESALKAAKSESLVLLEKLDNAVKALENML